MRPDTRTTPPRRLQRYVPLVSITFVLLLIGSMCAILIPKMLQTRIHNTLNAYSHLHVTGVRTAFPLRTHIDRLTLRESNATLTCDNIDVQLTSNPFALWRYQRDGRSHAHPVVPHIHIETCTLDAQSSTTNQETKHTQNKTESPAIGERIQRMYVSLYDHLAGVHQIDLDTLTAHVSTDHHALAFKGWDWQWTALPNGQHATGTMDISGHAHSAPMHVSWTHHGMRSVLEIRPEGPVAIGQRTVSFDIVRLLNAESVEVPHLNIEDATQIVPHVELQGVSLALSAFPMLRVHDGRIDFGHSPVFERLLRLSDTSDTNTHERNPNAERDETPLPSPANPDDVWSLRLLARGQALIEDLHEVLVVKNREWPLYFDLQNLDIRNEQEHLMRISHVVHTDQNPLSLDAQINRAQIELRTDTARANTWTLRVQDASLQRVSRFFEVGRHLQGIVDATVRFDLQDKRLGVEADIAFTNVTLTHEKVSAFPVGPFDMATTIHGVFPAQRTDDASLDARITLNGIPILFTLHAQPWQDRVDVTGRLSLGERMDCQQLWQAIPVGMMPHLVREHVRFTGNADPSLTFTYKPGVFESFSLKSTGFPDNCTITIKDDEFSPSILLDRHYRHHVTEGVTVDDIFVGPGTEDYVSLQSLPPYVPALMYLSEEIDFYKNNAISLGLINKGIRHSLPRRRYAYGGSTVTQQLVKNLFLSRTKTLSRKLEEAMIAWAVTQDVPKDRVLELYLNCIEFGPNLYGIVRASRYYFHKEPDDLTPLEAAWLATLKPSPSRGEREFRRGVTSGHRWLVERIQTLLQRLVDYGGFITQDDVEAAAPYVLHFDSATAPKVPNATKDVTDL